MAEEIEGPAVDEDSVVEIEFQTPRAGDSNKKFANGFNGDVPINGGGCDNDEGIGEEGGTLGR
jgi:hypothetical protein